MSELVSERVSVYLCEKECVLCVCVIVCLCPVCVCVCLCVCVDKSVCNVCHVCLRLLTPIAVTGIMPKHSENMLVMTNEWPPTSEHTPGVSANNRCNYS